MAQVDRQNDGDAALAEGLRRRSRGLQALLILPAAAAPYAVAAVRAGYWEWSPWITVLVVWGGASFAWLMYRDRRELGQATWRAADRLSRGTGTAVRGTRRIISRCFAWVRRPRFGLRTALVATLFFAVVCAAWKLYVAPYVARQRAVADIVRRGGLADAWAGGYHVQLDSMKADKELAGNLHVLGRVESLWLHKVDDSAVLMRNSDALSGMTHMFLSHDSIDEETCRGIGALTKLHHLTMAASKTTEVQLRHLRSLARLETLWLTGIRVDEDDLAILSGLPNLTNLCLAGCDVDDKALSHLRHLRGLKHLILRNCGISDEGLRYVAQATSLEVLDLARTRITDEGIRYAEQLDQLRELDLSFTPVTDACIETLEALQKLENVSLQGTGFSINGLKHLRQSPDLVVAGDFHVKRISHQEPKIGVKEDVDIDSPETAPANPDTGPAIGAD